MKPLYLRTYAFKAMFYIKLKIIWNDIYQLFTVLYAAFGVCILIIFLICIYYSFLATSKRFSNSLKLIFSIFIPINKWLKL